MSASSRLKSLLIAGCLFILLTVCFVQSLAYKVADYPSISHSFRQLEQLDSSLVNDLLKTRFQLLPHYDTVTRKTLLFTEHLSQLEASLSSTLAASPALAASFETLQQQHWQQRILIEDYKSDLALLTNSSQYLPTLLAQTLAAASMTENIPLLAGLHQAQASLVAYGLNNYSSDPQQLPIILSALSDLEPQAERDTRVLLQRLMQHIQIVERVSQTVLDNITAFSQGTIFDQLESLALEYDAFHAKLIQRQERYRIGLYVTSLLLLAYLLFLYRIQGKNVLLRAVNQSLEEKVTERTQSLNAALIRLKKSQSDRIHAEKMSGLGQLVAGIAHEFNNPIGFIHGNLNVIQNYCQDLFGLLDLYNRYYPQPVQAIADYEADIDLAFVQQDHTKVLASMRNGTQRVQTIVNSLKTFSRLGESGKKPADIHAGLDSVLMLLQHRFRPTTQRPEVTLIKDYASLPPVTCYPSELNQALMHILNNAIDALDEIDRADPRTAPPEIMIQTRTLQTPKGDAFLEIMVTDNGGGIPATVRPQIFDPFFTTKPVGQGAGLGLAVAYQVIHDLHGGDISCDTQLNVGTKFCLSIPLGELSPK